MNDERKNNIITLFTLTDDFLIDPQIPNPPKIPIYKNLSIAYVISVSVQVRWLLILHPIGDRTCLNGEARIKTII